MGKSPNLPSNIQSKDMEREARTWENTPNLPQKYSTHKTIKHYSRAVILYILIWELASPAILYILIWELASPVICTHKSYKQDS